MSEKSESGQAIVLLVFGIIALIGFTALAIDGGMVYADRRHAQSASDAASLAGGGFAALSLENYHISYSDFDCSSADLTTIRNNSITIATNRAISNDYTNAEVTVTTVCEDNGSFFDKKYLDITTQIQKTTNTALIHFVYNGPVVNQVESTVRVRPRSPLAFGHAIVALNEDACKGNQNGIIVGGSSETRVNGGGIFSNGCLKCNGSCPNFEVSVTNGDISYAGSTMHCESANLSPPPQQAPGHLPASSWDVPPPDCSGLPNRSIPGGKDVTLNPGVYDKITDNGKDSVTLNPGLYCVTGSPLGVNFTHGVVYGNGVTLYVIDGGVTISGGGGQDDQLYLSAPATDPDPSPAIPGVLIYLAHGNSRDVHLTGNSESIFQGTVYAPDGDIIATGSGELASFNTQLIGLDVKVEGDAIIDINFNGQENYSKPASLDLNR